MSCEYCDFTRFEGMRDYLCALEVPGKDLEASE